MSTSRYSVSFHLLAILSIKASAKAWKRERKGRNFWRETPCWERRRSMAKFWFILHSRSAARISCSECSLNISCNLWTAFAMATSAAFTSLATSFARFLLAFDFPIFFHSRDSTRRRTNKKDSLSLASSIKKPSFSFPSLSLSLSLSIFGLFYTERFCETGK